MRDFPQAQRQQFEAHMSELAGALRLLDVTIPIVQASKPDYPSGTLEQLEQMRRHLAFGYTGLDTWFVQMRVAMESAAAEANTPPVAP